MSDIAEAPKIDERRIGNEPPLLAGALIDEFPELKTIPEGASRAKAAIRLVLKDYIGDAGVKAALMEKRVRHFAGYDGAMAVHQGYYILASGKEQGAAPSDQPAIDGQALFQRYVDSGNAEVEDVKDVLFAIRREANKLKNAANPKLKRLQNLASLAIFEFQQQRRKDVGI